MNKEYYEFEEGNMILCQKYHVVGNTLSGVFSYKDIYNLIKCHPVKTFRDIGTILMSRINLKPITYINIAMRKHDIMP